jgi:hypothetical protein
MANPAMLAASARAAVLDMTGRAWSAERRAA